MRGWGWLVCSARFFASVGLFDGLVWFRLYRLNSKEICHGGLLTFFRGLWGGNWGTSRSNCEEVNKGGWWVIMDGGWVLFHRLWLTCGVISLHAGWFWLSGCLVWWVLVHIFRLQEEGIKLVMGD